MEQGTKEAQKPKSEEESIKPEVQASAEVKKPVKKPASKKGGKERFFRVKFADKRSPNDSDDVVLSVNGEVRHIQRGKEVVLPERYLICADNASFPQFTQMPGEARKIVGHIKVFPYDRIGEATEKDYREMLREGTLRTQEEVKKNMQNQNQ